MTRLFQVKATFILVFSVLFFCGCGSGDNRYSVSGTINFKGKPLDQGSIEFHSEDEKEASFGSAQITNGEYAIPATQGLKPGKYRVIISSGDPKQKVKEEQLPGEAGPPAKERIPAEFNEFSKLTFEVKAGQQNVFNKDIP